MTTLREAIASIVCLLATVGIVAVIDTQLRGDMYRTLWDTWWPVWLRWEQAATALGAIVVAAARDQTFNDAPILVFMAVGLMLMGLMLRA